MDSEAKQFPDKGKQENRLLNLMYSDFFSLYAIEISRRFGIMRGNVL